jgi:LPS-assembly protein
MNLGFTALAACVLSLAPVAIAQSNPATPAPTAPPAGDELSQSFSDIPIDITADQFDASGILATAKGNVLISYGATTIYADEAMYDPNTRDVIVTGNVRIYRDGRLVTAERAVYNLESKDITAASVRGETLPFVFSGESFQNIAGSKGYVVKDGLFTTSDTANPDWSMRARRVRIYPNDRVILQDVKLYIGNTPIMWFPYVYQSLNQKNALTFTPGYSSVWGAYLLNTYTFPISENVGGTLHLDLRSDRGVALGFDTEWETGERKQNWGRFRSYVMDDISPETNETALTREPIDSGRYRVSFQAKQYFTDDIFASVDINILSDERFLQDFYEGEFRENPQPDNMIALTKMGEDYSLTLLARKQFNEFFDGTERLPEAALDITRQSLFGTKFFYEGETSVGRYNRNFADGSQNQDYDATRFDTFHQILYPQTFGGWLSVVPRIGVRGTWYSDSGTFRDFEEFETVKLADGTEEIVSSFERRLVEEGSVFRPVLNAGVELSFKASKAYEQTQSRIWGLDGLRHIVQPYVNLSFVYAGEDAASILQFDRLQGNTLPPAVDFPGFSAIDSIDDWNIVRLGVRNRLQTRRDNATFNWLELNSFVDLRFNELDLLGLDPDPGTFSNFVNRLRWAPLSWVTFTLDAQLPLFDSGFTEVNTRANFLVNDKVQLNVGHRYLDGNVLFRDSSLLDFGGYVRFNDNWGFSFRDTYEVNDSTLESQRYELHRDLSSWVASLGVLARTNKQDGKEVTDYGVILTFTLKDLPGLRVPISLDPTGSGGTGSGRNR